MINLHSEVGYEIMRFVHHHLTTELDTRENLIINSCIWIKLMIYYPIQTIYKNI